MELKDIDIKRLSRDYQSFPLLRDHRKIEFPPKQDLIYLYQELDLTQEDLRKYFKVCIGKITEFLIFYDIPVIRKGAKDRKAVAKKAKETYFKKTGYFNPSQNPEIKLKKQQTCFEHFGVKNPGESKEILEKIKTSTTPESRKAAAKKAKETYFKKTGYESPLQDPKIKEKIKQNNLEKYGCESPNQNEEVKRRKIISYKLKTGYENPFQNPEVIEKIRDSYFQKTGYYHNSENPEVIAKRKETFLKNYGVDSPMKSPEIKAKFKHKELQEKRIQSLVRHGTQTISLVENEIYYILLMKFPDCIHSYKDNRYPFLCDFYIPSLDLFIEYQGTWMHGEHPYNPKDPKDQEIITNWQNRNTDQHKSAINVWTVSDLLKRETARKNALNWLEFFSKEEFLAWYNNFFTIKYINFEVIPYLPNNSFSFIEKTLPCFWDWEWEQKNDICQSILLKSKEKIYARSCSISLIDKEITKKFLEVNHIQGAIPSSINIGLFYKNELVQLMTFGKPRYNKQYEWELLRLCSKKYYNIIGGASKLFKYFIKNYKPKSVVSYCDRRIFTGKIYEKLGFLRQGLAKPNYSYIGEFQGSRINFQKHKLKNILPIFYAEKSEKENMALNNSFPVYDKGNDTWIWKGTI